MIKASANTWEVYKKNQALAGSSLKPDLVLVRDNVALILDVPVAFENGPQAFDKIRNIKIKKYQGIANNLKKKFSQVSVEAIVLGSLGPSQR